MKFIDIILQNSQAREAKLVGPATKASTNPETGVTILNPAAFHVIQDCAKLTIKYIPHYVFGVYANPFEVLKGKFEYNVKLRDCANSSFDIVLGKRTLYVVHHVYMPTNNQQ
jgi:hypothetical protein